MELGTIYSNVETFEGTVNGSEDFSLSLYSRKIIITNDSGLNDLKFYPKGTSTGTYMTLKPTETITLDRFRSSTFGIEGNNTDYRIWSIG